MKKAAQLNPIAGEPALLDALPPFEVVVSFASDKRMNLIGRQIRCASWVIPPPGIAINSIHRVAQVTVICIGV